MSIPRFLSYFVGFGTLLVPWAANADSKPIGIMDAIQQALQNHPSVMIGKQSLKVSRGSVQVAEGSFDWALQGNVGHTQSGNGGPLDIGSDSYDYSNQSGATTMGLSVSKLLPWGMTVSSAVNASRTSSGFEIAGPDTSSVSSTPLLGSVSFTVSQPLLRGFGSVTTAERDARKHELTASKSDYEQSIVNQVRQVVSAYWTYVSAHAFLAAAQDSEKRSRRLLKDNKKLVKADLRPAAELRQLEANYSDVKQSTYRAEQSVLSAKYNLGVAMGLDANQTESLGKPSTGIPQPPSVEESNLAAANYLQTALTNRHDLKALQSRSKAAKLRVTSTDNAKLPNLDLSGTLRYAGLGADDDYSMTAIQGGLTNLLGYTAVVNLNFSWPPQNNVADGLHTQTVAAHRIAQEAERSLKQVIGASVYSSVSGLEKRAKIAFEGMKAARLYEESVQNEEKKLKAGLSTLINLVLTQERLAGARANAITGLQSYAEAILAFRFATGTLMDSGSGSAQIRPQGLLEFPKENK